MSRKIYTAFDVFENGSCCDDFIGKAVAALDLDRNLNYK